MKKAPWLLWYEIDALTCANCSYVVRGANSRTFCVLNHHMPEGEISGNLTILGHEDGMEVISTIQKRILLGMTHPHEEPACSSHPELRRRAEVKAFEELFQGWLDTPVDKLWLTVNISNTLKAEGIWLRELINMWEREFLKTPKIWPKFAMEVRQFLRTIGVDWRK